jgi:methyltransferase
MAERNRALSQAHGGIEFGSGHYPVMVALHAALLAGCLIEPITLHRSFIPTLGWPMLAIVLAAQALRCWCITTLNYQWNTRVIVIPGADRITGGPYRFVPHPNYVAVIAEGFALPLVHTAWITALAFSILNAALLATRVRVENAALASLTPGQLACDAALGHRPGCGCDAQCLWESGQPACPMKRGAYGGWFGTPGNKGPLGPAVTQPPNFVMRWGAKTAP